MKVSAFSVIVFFFAFSVTGYFLLPQLPVKLTPDRASRDIGIHCSYPGMAAAKVEQEVSLKLEGVIATLPEVKNIRTISAPGQCDIAVTLDENVNIREAKLEISTLVRQLHKQLPEGASYPIITAGSGNTDANSVILSYTFSGPGTAREVATYFDRRILPAINSIPAINKVIVGGRPVRKLVIRYNNAKLNTHGITGETIGRSISKYIERQQLGRVSETDDNGKERRVYLSMSNIVDGNSIVWQQIPVATLNGHTVLLGDVATVAMEEEDVNIAVRINAHHAITIGLMTAGYTKSLKAEAGAEQITARLRKQLPAGYDLILQDNAVSVVRSTLTETMYRVLAIIVSAILAGIILFKGYRHVFVLLLSQLCIIGIWSMIAYTLQYTLTVPLMVALSIAMIFSLHAVIIRMVNRLFIYPSILYALAGIHAILICTLLSLFVTDEFVRTDMLYVISPLIIYTLISFASVWLLVPALCDKLQITGRLWRRTYTASLLRFPRYLLFSYTLLYRCRWLLIPGAVLLFGLPMFLLPEYMQPDRKWARLYNNSIGSSVYQHTIRPVTDKWLGGTLSQFVNHPIPPFAHQQKDQRTELQISISVPVYISNDRLLAVIHSFEDYLKDMPQIEQLNSRMGKDRNAQIRIVFKDVFAQSGFPFYLKNRLEEKAAQTGLASFIITGLGAGFNNVRRSELGNYMIEVAGYNYRQLYTIASDIRKKLLEQPRVKSAVIRNTTNNTESVGESISYDFSFATTGNVNLRNADMQAVAKLNGSNSNTERPVVSIPMEGQLMPVVLQSDNSATTDLWTLMHTPIGKDSTAWLRLAEMGAIDTISKSSAIVRQDQQYNQVVHYTLLGDEQFGAYFRDNMIAGISAHLPIGYKVAASTSMEALQAARQLCAALLLAIAAVFIICSVALNNLIQPVYITLTVLFSFIGVFIIAILVEVPFNDCAIAFFLCGGFVVSAALLITTVYNSLLAKYSNRWSVWLLFITLRKTALPVIVSVVFSAGGFLSFCYYTSDITNYLKLVCVAGSILIALPTYFLLLPICLAGRRIQQQYHYLKRYKN